MWTSLINIMDVMKDAWNAQQFLKQDFFFWLESLSWIFLVVWCLFFITLKKPWSVIKKKKKLVCNIGIFNSDKNCKQIINTNSTITDILSVISGNVHYVLYVLLNLLPGFWLKVELLNFKQLPRILLHLLI